MTRGRGSNRVASAPRRAVDDATPRIDITLGDVQAARDRIAGHARRTPIERSIWLSERLGVDVYLKLECWQPTRSFKVRGALNAVAAMDAASRERGLVTASAGNHGQAIALAARAFGASARIFVPRDAPEPKRARIRSLGAELDEAARDYDEAEDAARLFAERTDRTFVHGFSDPAVVAGQGTIGLEVAEALPDVREVVVPVGGGGLAAGVGVALAATAPHARLIGVQSEKTPAMYEAFRAGRVVGVPVVPTWADGLAGRTDESAYLRARRLLADLRLVGEAAIADAIVGLYSHDGVVAEGSAAVTAAAVLTLDLGLSGPTVLVISGGNIEGARLGRLLVDGGWR